MANYTNKYKLTKPLGTDLYNINVQNENMDKIDTALGNIEKTVTDHDHNLTGDKITGILPVNKGGTGATTPADALQNLGIIYSETAPVYQAGAIWLKPVD